MLLSGTASPAAPRDDALKLMIGWGVAMKFSTTDFHTDMIQSNWVFT